MRALRIQDIREGQLFVSLDLTEEGSNSLPKRVLIKAWTQTKVKADQQTKIDANAKVHSEPFTMLTADWIILRVQFKVQYGHRILDDKLSAQSYIEALEEKFPDGTLEAETLAHVVSNPNSNPNRRANLDCI